MRNVKRYFQIGDVFAATCVTRNRNPILLRFPELVIETIAYIESNLPCSFDAWVQLPDHVHLVVNSYTAHPSKIIKRFKEKLIGAHLSRIGLRSGTIWQQRFYDHIIRNDKDWKRQVNYIHGNPVKHGFVADPFHW